MYPKINTVNEQVKYSNTYNVFVKIYKNNVKDKEWANAEINARAEQAYTKGKNVFTIVISSNLMQEIKFYNGIVHCFATINSYRVLYNYLSLNELEVNDEIELLNVINSKNINLFNRIRFINSNSKIGEITTLNEGEEQITCKVINTYESFIDYTTTKSLPLNKSSNIPFHNDFVENLNSSKVKLNPNNKYGVQSYNPNLLHSFTYIYLQEIIIITSYI